MRVRAVLLAALVSILACSCAAWADSAAGGECPRELVQLQGWTIREVRVTTPFGFIAAAKTVVDGAESKIPFKAGDAFDLSRFSAGQIGIRDYFVSAFPHSSLIVVLPAVEACSGRTVTVRYKVFTALIPMSTGDALEIASRFIAAPGPAGGLQGSSGRWLTVPALNYNHTRGLYGGGEVSAELPLRIFDTFKAAPALSANSYAGELSLSGKADPKRRFLNHASWQLGTDQYNVPVTTVSVSKATLGLAGFGSSKQLASAVTLHYGGMVAGGHVQDGFHFTPNSSYGEIRLLTGYEAVHGQLATSGGYGLELGSDLSGTGVFAKNAVQTAMTWVESPLPRYLNHAKAGDANTRDDRADFIGVVHRPLSIEIQANAGMLSRSAAVPSVERFFGGNQSARFIPGQPWNFTAQPFIRSIAENELGAITSSRSVGGARFYSGNLTLGKAIAGRALIPRDLGDKEFLDALDGGIQSSIGELSDYYFNKNPEIAAVGATVKQVTDNLTNLKQELASLPSGLPVDSAVGAALVQVGSSVRTSIITVRAVANGGVNQMPILLETKLPAIESQLGDLASAVSAAGDVKRSEEIEGWKNSLEPLATQLAAEWQKVNPPAAHAAADAHAKSDFAPAVSVLDSLLYRLNVYSVAPVATLDMARVWPGQGSTRFGVGGGMRLSIVNANFTGGYAANVTRTGREGPGAFWFSLTFTDLFH